MPLQQPVPRTDGRKVFVVGRTLRGELARYKSQSGRFEPFLGGISADDPSPQIDPNWSPDGGKIVFSATSGDPSQPIRILDLATHQITTLPGSQGLFSPRWSPEGRYIAALSSDHTKLLIFDSRTQKWAELAKGSLGWPSFTKDGQYLYFGERSNSITIMRARMSDLHVERFADLKNVVTVGHYHAWFAPTPDGYFMLLRDAGTTDVYSLDWEEP